MHLSPAGNGWLAGQPFERDGRRVAVDCTDPEHDPVEVALAQRWWGGFLVAGRDATGRVRLLRDPSGVVPCYYLRVRDKWFFGSDARALFAKAGQRASLDREALGLALRFSDLRTEQTSLEGLRELLPGQLCTFQADGIRLSSDWIAERWRPSPNPPAASVRRAVIDGVRYTLAGLSSPLIQLSGGLDSAIVAAAARRFRDDLSAINLVTPDVEGDERLFARAIARHLGLRLREREIRVDDVDILTTRAGFLPRPTHRAFAQAMDDAVQDIAGGHGHDAVLTGGGGDSVFSYLMPGCATSDPLAGLALTSAFSTALDEAVIEQVSAWRILRLAFRHLVAREAWRETKKHLSADILSLAPPDHPWLRASRRWPPGRRSHLALLVLIHNYLDCFGASAVPVHFPLMHRPVLDACLAIASADWVAGGRNRSVARQAFASDLPLSIIHRRSKGTYERFAAQLFERNRTAIRDHLLGGLLRDLGIVDTVSLETWFASQQPLRSNRMLALTEAESWCRHWAG
ncbi:hypothetical protein HJG53_13840 [Sphingomonas sp. ID1715]|nr:asparagine synthase-related protein [Sphingomonas sp. ID1715]NNM77985.1 hypothetical protein [Sphingomonas sp. ID1715]